MLTSPNPLELFDTSEELEQDIDRRRIRINGTLTIVDQGGVRVIFQWQEPLFRFSLSDVLSLRYAAVQLRLGKLATQEEIAQAFGHSVPTQRRWETRFLTRGLEGLLRGKNTGRPLSIPTTLDGVLRKWFEEGVSNREMAKRLGVSQPTIHRALARLGLHRQIPVRELPWPVESAEEVVVAEVTEDRQACPVVPAEDQENGAARVEVTDLEEEAGSRQEEDEPQKTLDTESSSSVWECFDAAESHSSQENPPEATAKQSSVLISTTGSAEPCRSENDAEAEECEISLLQIGEPLEEVLASLEAKGFSIDRDPDDRCGDRTLARLGLLEDATPLFANRPAVRQAGVLLAIPLLVQSKLLEVFSSVYHSLGPAFYGLRTTVVVLFVGALLRIKRPEHFKEHNPRNLGHVVGLDRVPEVKTVRRKLEDLVAQGRACELMMEMAKQRISEDPQRVAFLYIDGHVRVYHGKHALAKTKKSQDQVAKPAATDYWVHDAEGQPLLVVTSELNESLTQMLEPILEDVKTLLGERRVSVIFDRGGYSPKLFARLDKLGFDVMTYRKGSVTAWPTSHFVEEILEVEGRRYSYRLAERKRVRVGRLRPKTKKASSTAGPQFFWMREVRVLRSDGRQTSILTTNQHLEKTLVAYRQFNRWRQENFFKYMLEEFELDGLLEYGADQVSSEADRPNPARRPLERQLAAARQRVQSLQAQLGSEVAPKGATPQRTTRGFKIAHAELRAQIAEGEAEVARLRKELQALPRRVPASDLEALKTERKLIADTIKMTAYQVETHLLGLLGEHYSRTADEGRTLLQSAFQSTARIELREDELYVELTPQSSPHRTNAIAALCDELNTWGTKFPGTHLRLRLGIQPHEPLKIRQG